MSLGGSTPSVAMHEFIKDLYAMNIPVVCAAGNSGFAGVGYPAAFPETIAVGAFDQYGKIAGFSSRGSQVDWAAPGANIYSTYLKNSYASLSGTSMACPFMAAIIALMISKHRKQEKETGKNDCKTVEDIRQHLLKYTNDKGNVGKDNDWGYGVVDIEKLITGESSKPTTTTLKPTTTTLKPTTTTFKPTTTTPKPKTEPPSSTPPPKKESSFVKKNIAWIVAGVFALVCLGIVIYQYAEEEYEPVDWGIDWDERYNNDPARPR
jgi:subtilisin family serine protease